ncbi:nuclear transport factor 2 family protein [Tabrizicola sp.]|uniref:nuclear transport factor 2 family protein n=1 Tax=Tabrizicola sp. TaxID=2005166 RepID=UPI003F3B0DA0
MQTQIENLLDDALRLMVADTRAWSHLLTEDVILDFPYAPSIGWPGRLVGREAVYQHIADALPMMPDLKFSNVRKFPTTDPNLLWAEVHGSGNVPQTGKKYEQDYVVKLIMKDGKVAQYSEYWNPIAMKAYEKD